MIYFHALSPLRKLDASPHPPPWSSSALLVNTDVPLSEITQGAFSTLHHTGSRPSLFRPRSSFQVSPSHARVLAANKALLGPGFAPDCRG
jgi:hypothetical protein